MAPPLPHHAFQQVWVPHTANLVSYFARRLSEWIIPIDLVESSLPSYSDEWKNPYKVSLLITCTAFAGMDKYFDWNKTARFGQINSAFMNRRRFNTSQTVKAHAYMHIYARLICVGVNTSIQLTRQCHWARFAFPSVPGHEATFSNAVTLFLKQAFLSLSGCTYTQRRLRGKSTPAVATESTLTHHLWHAIKMYLLPLLCSRSNKNNLGMCKASKLQQTGTETSAVKPDGRTKGELNCPLLVFNCFE